ncbi:MAG: hypothetical protein P8X89_21465 [Reinekea sp.]
MRSQKRLVKELTLTFEAEEQVGGKNTPIQYDKKDIYRNGQRIETSQIIQTYKTVEKDVTYPLQYAPHHLIPGNASLKGSALAAYLGDTNAIKHYDNKGKVKSVIKEGQSTGYDVNAASNGAWLPSSYALSKHNKWPPGDGIQYVTTHDTLKEVKVVKRAKITINGKDTVVDGMDMTKDKTIYKKLATEIEESRVSGGLAVAHLLEGFKKAYAYSAIDNSGSRQFHTTHKDYSREVEKVLDKIADKLALFETSGVCPEMKDEGDSDTEKLNAPMGLPERLNILSDNLENLLTGHTWHWPFILGDYTEKYIEDRQLIENDALKVGDKITRVL